MSKKDKLQIPSAGVLLSIVEKHNKHLEDTKTEPEYDGPKCSHGNPKGNCFDCEE